MKNIKVGSIVEWFSTSHPDIGIVLKCNQIRGPYVVFTYDVYWFVEKVTTNWHVAAHLKVLVP